MDIEIRPIGRTDDALAAMLQIGLRCFDEHYSNGLLRRNWTSAHPASVFLGAYAGDKLAAYNGFLAHPLTDGSIVFQSCHSATDPDFRGQGLFSKLIRTAEKSLPGKYIVGFPNSQSGPIFQKKLDYSFDPLVRLFWPTWGGGLLLSDKPRTTSLEFDEEQTLAAKEREYPGQIQVLRHGASFMWGGLQTQKLKGVSVRVFHAGGLHLDEVNDLPALLQAAGKLGARLARAITTESGWLSKSSRLRFSGHATEPFIYKAVNGNAREVNWTASVGLKDAWAP